MPKRALCLLFACAFLAAGCGDDDDTVVIDDRDTVTQPAGATPAGTVTPLPQAGAPTSATIPNVIGKSLVDARAELEAAGMATLTVEDASGANRAITDEADWNVSAIDPPVGENAGPNITVVVKVLKNGE